MKIKFKDQRGVTAVVVAIVISMLMGFVALAVDIGYVAATKNELQNIADSAALAGAGLLGQIYLGMDLDHQQSYVCDNEDNLTTDPYAYDNLSIIAQAKDVVGSGKNKAGGQDIVIDDNDVIIGQWNGNSQTFTPTTSSPDAVRVTSRRDGVVNGPISSFFAKIFGINTVDVRADAIASLTGPAVMNEGEMNLPIGLSQWQFFDNCDPEDENEGICSDEIKFSPTTESCAGWHNFFDPINADDEDQKILGFIEGNECEGEDCDDVPSGEPLNGDEWLDEKFDIAEHKQPPAATTPATTAGGSMYFFQGGTMSSLFNGGRLLWDDDPEAPEGEGIRTVPRLQDPNLDYHPVSNPQLIDGQAKTPAPFPALFDYFRFRDGDGNNSIWTAVAPVYEDGCPCDNPNTELTIVGFATVEVRMPNPPPDSTVTATVYCDFQVIEGRGGGGTYGPLKGSIPNLVE